MRVTRIKCHSYHTSFLSLGPLPACLAGAKFCELEHAANTTPVPDSHQLAAEGSELMGIWEHWGGSRSNFKTHSPMRQAHGGLEKDVWNNESGGEGAGG